MCAYKYLKWYIIRLTVGRHYMLSNGKYVINMLNPYRYIQRILCPILLQVILQQLRNFMVPSHSGNIQGCLAVLRPWLWDSQQLMTRSLYASHNEGRYWKGEKAMGNICILYIIIYYIYIYYVFERYPWRHAKKWRRPGCGPLFWFEFAQAFSILWCSDWSDSRKTSWWLPMVQWYHDISQKGQVLVQQQRVGAGTAQRGTNLHGPCLRKTIFLPFFIYFVFCLSKAHKIWCATQSAELVSLHVPIQCTMFSFRPIEFQVWEVYHIKIIQFQMVATGCYRKLPQFLSRV